MPASQAATPPALTGRQRRFLRALGHDLKPVVHVGKGGLGPGVAAQVEECLLAHELIKVKVLETAPVDTAACARELEAATGAACAQRLGRTVLLYRPHPEEPVLKLP